MTKKIKQKTKKSKDGLSYEEFYKKKKKDECDLNRAQTSILP